jgi:hypothetical protein
LKKPPPLVPVKHPQKLLIKGGHGLQPERTFMQTMTAFGSFNATPQNLTVSKIVCFFPSSRE